MQNPINLVDPTGMSSEEPGDPPKSKKSINDGLTQGAINYGKKLLGFGMSLALNTKETAKQVAGGVAQQLSDLVHKDKGNPASNVIRRTSDFIDESRSSIKNSSEPEFAFGAILGEQATGLLVDVVLTKGGLRGASLLDDALVMSEKAAQGGATIGAGRTGIKQWLQNAGNLERGELIQNIESVGFKRMSPTSSPVSVFERGGMRIRLDPPQSGTPFNHMHLEYGGNSYNNLLNPVHYKSPAAHIPIK
jgi:hypothetical protein